MLRDAELHAADLREPKYKDPSLPQTALLSPHAFTGSSIRVHLKLPLVAGLSVDLLLSVLAPGLGS